MGLFGGSKIPSIDVNALRRIAEENASKQRNIISGLRTSLTPLNTKFEAQRGALSARIPTETEANLTRYGTDLSGIGKAEQEANQAAGTAFRQQAFRDVPELQRSIRESLGSSGTIGNAAAVSALARPTLEANRAARDFSSGLETQRLQNIAGRNEKFTDTGFNARSNAMADRLGLDKDTIDYLTSIGREDLVREGQGLLGVEDQLGSNYLTIEQARQANEIAKANAAASNRAGILSSLGSLGGAAIGFGFGGPLGAGLGSQLGGTVGNLAGGGTGATFDPTLLYAMAQRNPATATRRTAVVNSLGGQIPVRPY